MATPYPPPEPLFEVEDPELDRLRKAWERENREYYRHQRERGWGDTTVCLGPDGPRDLPDWGLASRSRS